MLFTGRTTTAVQGFILGPHLMKDTGESRSTQIRTTQVKRVIKANSKSLLEVSEDI